MRRKKEKLILSMAVITIAIVAGIMIPAHLHSGKHVDVSAEEMEAALTDTMVQSTPKEKNPPQKELSTEQNTFEATEKVQLHTSKTSETETTTKAEVIDPDLDYDWVEARIQKHRNEIHEDDLEDFRLIMGKLDLGHISAIVNGEIPGDMEQLLRDYLLSQLDAREYEKSKTLFLLYNHLMYEE